MATNIQDVAPYDTIAHFDSTAILIRRTFNVLIEQLIKRRDILCQEVAQLRDDFHLKESARVAAIEDLEITQQQMQQMSLKSNINLHVHEQASLMYQEAKQKLCVPTPLPNLSFSCSTLSLLQSQIEQFGEVVQLKAPKYSEKKQPILTAGEKHDETCEVRLDASSLESETGSEPLTYYNRSEFETATEEPSPMEKCRFCHKEFESAVTRTHMEECLLNPEVAKDHPEALSIPYATCTKSPDSSCDSDSEEVCQKCHGVFTLSGLKSHAEECHRQHGLEKETISDPSEVIPSLPPLLNKPGTNCPKPFPRSVISDPDKETPIFPTFPLPTDPFPLILLPPIPSKVESEKIQCNICRKEILVEEMPSHVEECRDKEKGQCPHCKEAFLITVLPDHTEMCQSEKEERWF